MHGRGRGPNETEVNDHGERELKVFFPEAPVGQDILAKVVDQFEHKQTFEFTRTDWTRPEAPPTHHRGWEGAISA
jgi:hypothetical protein